MIPAPIARVLYAVRVVVRSALAIGLVLFGVGLAVQCAGCGSGATLATVVASAKPVAEAGCFAVRRAAELCDAALGPEAGAESCEVTAGGETDAAP